MQTQTTVPPVQTPPPPGLDDDALGLVADSFAAAFADAEAVGALFYARLFARAPALRRFFKGDLDAQSMKLMDTLNVAVAHLGHPDVVMPIAEDLARRHVAYGVRAEHYALVGDTLVETLAAHLGPAAFDPLTRAAWERAYASLSAAMIAAAYDG